MLIEGEKYACEACVRGHRVSTCQHSDRPLTHINKKGRPVSQCPHCRGLRKARASHVACECGVKHHTKEECEPEIKNEEIYSDSTSDPGSEQQHHTCCCSHGARCTCSLKKEHLDPVPEVDSHSVACRKRTTSNPKPRLLKAGSSDNALTVFTNGHHKPVHKHNDSAHKCGLPYKIPIPHSIHGNADIARRSTDSLPIIRKREDAHSQLQESIASAQQEPRRVRSEHGSPEPGAVLFRDNSDLPALDLSYTGPQLTGSNPSQYEEGFIRSPQAYDSNFYTVAEDTNGLNSVVDWSALELNGTYAAAFSQPPSYASYDQSNVAQSGLTTSSSGDVSESGDYVSHNPQQQSLYRQDLAATTSAETRSLNRLSSSSYTSMPQLSMLSTSNIQDLPTSPPDLEVDFHRTTASPTEFEETRGLHSDAWERHGFTVHDAQKLAHPETPTEAMGTLSLPLHSDEVDAPLWSGGLDPKEDTFVSQEMVEGREAWS